MPIEFSCANCANTLRVPDEHAGKQAKCPACDQLNSIPLSTVAAGASPLAPPASSSNQSSNPYAPSVNPVSMQAKAGGDAIQAFRPLFESVFFIKFAGWYLLISGVLACLTIFGIIVGWLPIWTGICLKNAARDIENGYPSGDAHMLHRASTNLATVAKIYGVCCMIGIAISVLYFVVAVIIIFGSIASGL